MKDSGTPSLLAEFMGYDFLCLQFSQTRIRTLSCDLKRLPHRRQRTNAEFDSNDLGFFVFMNCFSCNVDRPA